MNRKIKLIGAISVTVVLGAVGSGVWEYVLKPGLSGTTAVVLDIATLGIDSYKDSLYSEVARGFREKSSVTLLSVAMYLIGIFAVTIAARIFPLWSRIMRSHGISSNPETQQVKSSLLKTVQHQANRIVFQKPSAVILIIGYIFISVFMFVGMTRVIYVNSAQSHFYQSLRIIAPYIKIQKEQEMVSAFSSVSTELDYRDLIAELKSIAQQNSETLPKFEIW